MLMVKANAYGHGAIEIAKIASARGSIFLGVASLQEALELRLGGITSNVLMFCEPNVDLTDLKSSIEIGNEVVIVGRQNISSISFEEIAREVGTTNEEVLTSISPRIKRFYV